MCEIYSGAPQPATGLAISSIHLLAGKGKAARNSPCKHLSTTSNQTKGWLMECDVKPNENSNLPQTVAWDLQKTEKHFGFPQEFLLHSCGFKNEPVAQQTCNKKVDCDG